MKFCEICGREAECTHHLIFGYSIRKLADQDQLTMDLCNDCHNMGRYRIHDNPVSEKLSKMLGQTKWELDRVAEGMSKEQARKCFIERYGRSWNN